MLAREELYALLEKREALTVVEAQTLEKLLEVYPYFQACALRLAVDSATKQQPEELRARTIGRAAALLPNLLLLYEQLSGEQPWEVAPQEECPVDVFPEQITVPLPPVSEEALPDVLPLPVEVSGEEATPPQAPSCVPELSEGAVENTASELTTAASVEGGAGASQPLELDLTDVLDRSLSTEVPGISPTLCTMPEAKSSLSPEDIAFINEELNAQMPDKAEDAPAPLSAIEQQQALIDSFLNNLDELVVKVRTQAEEDEANHVVPENLAADQQTLDADIASERLAELLAKKGQVAQAVSMYRELMQRNPEKSAYFALAIERLGGTPNA